MASLAWSFGADAIRVILDWTNSMNILVLNCGSSSVKFQLIATNLDLIAQDADRRLAKGTISSIISFRRFYPEG